jgi:hypothetical protein
MSSAHALIDGEVEWRPWFKAAHGIEDDYCFRHQKVAAVSKPTALSALP